MDIAPTARDAHWQALVEQAAVGEVAPLASAAGSFVDKLVMLERYYPTFPSLAQSSAFMKLRATVGLDAFRRCFERAAEQYLDPAPCRDHLDAFARAEPVDLSVAKGAAALVAQRGDDAAAARFYAIMLAAGENVCAAPSVAKAAVAALREPVESSDAKAGKMLLDRCFEPLKDSVLDTFAQVPPASPYMKNSCPALMAHNALSGLRAARCKELGSG